MHANLPALEAVLASIRDAGIVEGALTGDLVMRGAQPGGCIAAVRALGWPCARGNTDHKLATRPRAGQAHAKARREGSRAWTSNLLSDDDLRFLKELPRVVRLSLEGIRIAVMHGGPNDLRALIGRWTPAAELADLGRQLDVDVIVNGHTHEPLIRRVGDVLLVNPGSVGEGIPGDRRPRWAWLEAGLGGPEAHLELVPAPISNVR